MKKIFYLCTLVLLFSCGNKKEVTVKPKEKQLNISILLDLSDRISTTRCPATPEHYQRDLEIVKTVTEYFKSNMNKLTAWKAKGKIRVFFSPPPSSSTINEIAGSLKIDCSKLENKMRKQVYDTITTLFGNSLTQIYNQTNATSAWEGSDIWRFFKNDVRDYCEDQDTTYRNILIILTDGYLYHQQSDYNKDNRYSYLLTKNMKQFRNQNWKQQIDESDFGLMTERNDLQNLEVLVLELCAENSNNKIDEDIMKYVLGKWFSEMKVAKYQVYSSDLPSNTKVRVENFLNN